MRHVATACLAAVVLSGCVMVREAPSPPPLETLCKADALQNSIGAEATTALGAELLGMSGARTLRWIPPRTAVTQDYRTDRLNIEYDDNRRITAIRCG